MRRRLCLTGVVITMTALLSGCASDSTGSQETALQVYAASSLTSTFTELGERFEAEHDGVSVSFSFGGSSDLVAQLQQGASADVVATADTANMDKLSAAELVGDPTEFATNTLQIAVPPDNPAGITSFRELARPGLNLVVCAPEVPCGAAAQQVAEQAGIVLDPVSEEQSVTDVLGKVASGEADAGLVYVTDVRAAGEAVTGIPIPAARSVVNTYPIATVTDSGEPELAREFVDLVTGSTGQQLLGDAGFGAPRAAG